MNMTKHRVFPEMKRTGIVPVFYNSSAEYSTRVLHACYQAGIRAFEYTNRGSNALENFRQLAKYRDQHLPDIALGIGSIVDAPTAALFLAAGADFIVSPLLVPEIARLCNRRKVLWAAGCGTLTEIGQAEELGADLVKLFPGQQYGAGFVKAIKGPCPWTDIMPTGGITLEKGDMEKWFSAGITCFGIGSSLFNKYREGASLAPLTEELKNALEFVKQMDRP